MLTIKISIKGGKTIPVRIDADKPQDFVDKVIAHGFLDPASASYYPPSSILRVEVGPPLLQPKGTLGGR